MSIFDSFLFVDGGGAQLSLQDVITKYTAAHGITSLTVIGHSLGGALATFAAAELTFLKVAGVQDKLALWTFGSPAVGLPNFATAFDTEVNSSTRVWNVRDIVAYVPPVPFIHVSWLGSPIFPTFEQLKQLGVNGLSPRCEHVLPDYLWLLNGADFPGDDKCVNSRAVSADAERVARVSQRAMRQALNATGGFTNMRVAKQQAAKAKQRAKRARRR